MGGITRLFDSAGRRLYVSHATKVVVIDIDKDAVATERSRIRLEFTAWQLAAGFRKRIRELRSREQGGDCGSQDVAEPVSKVETGQNPDGLVYDPGRKEVYMFNGRSGSATVIDGKEGKVVATIPLDGKPEFPQVDPEGGRSSG